MRISDWSSDVCSSDLVALPLSAERRMTDVMTKLRRVAVDICLCPDQYGLHMDRVETEQLGGVTLLNAESRPLRTWRGVIKEIEERVFAGCILVMIEIGRAHV